MSDDFVLRSLIGGALLAVITGPVGAFMLWRKRAFFGALDEMSRYWVLSSTKKYSIIEAAREISKFFLDGITVCADKAADAPPTA